MTERKVRWWVKPCNCKVKLPDEPAYTEQALRKGWKPIAPPQRPPAGRPS